MYSLPLFPPRDPQTIAKEIEEQRERVRAFGAAAAERRRLLEEQRLMRIEEKERRWHTKVARRIELYRERGRALSIQQDEQRRRDRQSQNESVIQSHLLHQERQERRQARFHLQEELRHRDRERRDAAGIQAHLRYESISQAQRAQQRSLAGQRVIAFDGPIPSFLDQEYQYMKQASSTFPEMITLSIQMSCMKDYQRAMIEASRQLPCGLCGGLFQGQEVVSVSLQDTNMLHFCERTGTKPDSCAINDESVSLCRLCGVALTKRAIPPLSAGNFVNCLFCQDYPAVLKDLNTVEEAFIARAHVIGMFLKLTSGAKKGVSYRGSRGHCVAVRQDPSALLKILPAKRLQDHTTITVSWDRGTPPSEDNLARFCSVSKAKVLRALLWLCANNPVYRSVSIDYSVLDSWPDDHVPQEIRDAFITLGSEAGYTQTPVRDEREGYASSLRGGLFENDLDAEVEDVLPGSILSRSFFSDFHGQDPQPTPAMLASLQAILDDGDFHASTRGSDDSDICGRS
jgi:hypothetical protein